MKTQSINSWGPRSVSYWLAALVAAGIIFLGMRFIIAPEAGAEGFGIPLPHTTDALAYGRIKGIRDIFSGVVILLSLISRNRRATALVFGAAIMIPVSDCLTVLAANGPKDVIHLLIHGLTAGYMIVTTTLLFKARPTA